MSSLRIRRIDDREQAIRAVAAQSTSVGLRSLLGDLRHRAHNSRAPGRAVARAITFNAFDRIDWRWFPQGVTTSADAATGPEDGDRVHGRRLLVMSWYSKFGHRGSRLTFMDLDRLRYQHVLLVVAPTHADGHTDLAPLHVHAGGIVWHGDWIHVAATGAGFFTARVEDVMRTPPAYSSALGGARWILPMRFTHAADSDGPDHTLRYSFLSLDRSGANHPGTGLLVGEYGKSHQTSRLASFPLDPVTRLPELDEEGSSRPLLIADASVESAQGAVLTSGVHYLTASHGRRHRGSVYAGSPGRWRRFPGATPPGPEDLSHWPATDQLWSLAEHPPMRWVFAMDRSWFDGARDQ